MGRCEQILILATRVFGTRKLAVGWFIKPACGLAHQEPCSMVGTGSGYEQVITFLRQIEHGVYI